MVWRTGWENASFGDLRGKTVVDIEGGHEGSETITFVTEDGSRYEMYHVQDCCELVQVEEIVGDLDEIIGSEIQVAYEETNRDEPVPNDWGSFTWTFYTIRTHDTTVVIRWLGESNGYYSERVDFVKKVEDA